MERDTIISVNSLHKKFARSLKRSMFYGSVDVAKSMFGLNVDTSNLRKGEFWSLEDVSFELKKGEALGVVGQNGSGKTTLLRLINGIFPPDKGEISVRGRIGALIAVGAGFHPHLSGRENIYLNGTILGMERKQLDLKFDDIVKFADIGEFIDAPVATYSSGMSVRLGFAIAIHSDPEILLADEILAVGDLSFALKCYRKIAEFRDSGGSLILVSHSIQLIRNTCTKVLWLDRGKTRMYGPTQDVCDGFERYMLEKDAQTDQSTGVMINNDPEVNIPKVEFFNTKGELTKEFVHGERFLMRIYYDAKRTVNMPIFTVSISNPENIQVISNYTNYDHVRISSIRGSGHLDFVIDKLPLKPSQYKCTITLTDNNDISQVLEWHDKAHPFSVVSDGKSVVYGLINPFPKWDISDYNE